MAGQVPSTGLPVGTTLVYNAHLDQSFLSWLKTGIGTPDDLFQQINQTLWMKWDLTVVSSDYSAAKTAYGILPGPTPITLTVQLSGPKTYAQPDDIRGIIDGEIIDALASNPIVDSNISSFTIPQSAGGSGSSTDTGAPAVNTNPLSNALNAVGIDPSAIAGSISNAVGNATKNLGVGTGLLILVIVMGIAAMVWITLAPSAPARAIAEFRSHR